MNVTCSLCDSPQEIPDGRSSGPLAQAACEQCGANLVLLRRPPASAEGPAALRRPKVLGIAAVVLLCLFNYAILGSFSYVAFSALAQNHDPYEVEENLLSPMMLRTQGWTALHLAAARGQVEAVRGLLDHGHSLETKNNNGRTPLYEAAKRGRNEVLQLLIERGANLEAKGKYGYTPLMVATQRGHIATVQLLLARGANLNTRCDCASTVLYQAVQWGQFEIAKLLLEQGALVNEKVNGKTALQLAEEKNADEIAELLRQYGGKSFKVIDEHLKRGFDFQKRGDLEQAMVEYAAALNLDPANAEVYLNRGVAFRDSGQQDKALSDFQKAIELNPGYAEAYDNLAWVYAQRGKYDLSIQYWTRVIELKPNDGRAYNNRGIAFYFKGDTEAGLKDVKTACSLGFKEGCDVYAKYKDGGDA